MKTPLGYSAVHVEITTVGFGAYGYSYVPDALCHWLHSGMNAGTLKGFWSVFNRKHAIAYCESESMAKTVAHAMERLDPKGHLEDMRYMLPRDLMDYGKFGIVFMAGARGPTDFLLTLDSKDKIYFDSMRNTFAFIESYVRERERLSQSPTSESYSLEEVLADFASFEDIDPQQATPFTAESKSQRFRCLYSQLYGTGMSSSTDETVLNRRLQTFLSTQRM